VAIDQKRALGIERMAGEMDFSDRVRGYGFEPRGGIEAEIVDRI